MPSITGGLPKPRERRVFTQREREGVVFIRFPATAGKRSLTFFSICPGISSQVEAGTLPDCVLSRDCSLSSKQLALNDKQTCRRVSFKAAQNKTVEFKDGRRKFHPGLIFSARAP